MNEDWKITGPDGTEYHLVKKWDKPEMRGFIDLRVELKRKQTGLICRECTNRYCVELFTKEYDRTQTNGCKVMPPVWRPFYGSVDEYG